MTRMIVITSVCLAWFAANRSEAQAQSAWHSDYNKAREIARASKKPLLVVFRCVP